MNGEPRDGNSFLEWVLIEMLSPPRCPDPESSPHAPPRLPDRPVGGSVQGLTVGGDVCCKRCLPQSQ